MPHPTIVSSQEARKLILDGQAPNNLTVEGDLDLSSALIDTLPTNLHVKQKLILNECPLLQTLPANLYCYELLATASALTALPDDIQVAYRIDLSNCQQLQKLPEKIKVSTLILHGCMQLQQLPAKLEVFFLDISDCHTLETFPLEGPAILGRLNLRGCLRISALPTWLKAVGQLDISDCPLLLELPSNLQVRTWIDLENTQLHALPTSLEQVPLRWHSVRITPRIAFQPETITVDEIIATENTELRRVLIERMGQDAFVQAAGATVLDQDQDPGGERRLLRVDLLEDEPLVCLAVSCPSTGRKYMLRVPPTMKSCRQAAAWMAGFEHADDYNPLIET